MAYNKKYFLLQYGQKRYNHNYTLGGPNSEEIVNFVPN